MREDFIIWVGPDEDHKYNILCQIERTSNSTRLFCYKNRPEGIYCYNWVTNKELESKNYEKY